MDRKINAELAFAFSQLFEEDLMKVPDEIKETVFADSKIYYDGTKAISVDGTIAGSTLLLDEIVERLKLLGLYKPEYIENAWRYHGLDPNCYT